MIKKSIFRLVLIMVLVFSLPLSVNAETNDWRMQADTVNAQFRQVVSNGKVSKVYGTARGRVISSVELELADEGSGVIGVYASTLCHTAVKEIYMVVYLDAWDDSIQDWRMVDLYEYEWSASDYPDRDLSAVSVSFSLEGLSRGRTYSLRGVHVAKNFENVMEAMSSETDGITLN